MLLNNFYTVLDRTASEGIVKATIRFDKRHPIFEGHFPGQPVVPGVCMIQIVRELTEQTLGAKVDITKGDNIKFLSVINPDDVDTVNVEINCKQLSDISASIAAGSVTYFKFKGEFQQR